MLKKLNVNNKRIRLTPEEVAMKESMNRDYYHLPRVNYNYKKVEPKKRTKKEHYLYMSNKVHMKNYQIRNLRKEIYSINEHPKAFNKEKIIQLNLRIKKLEKLLSLIVVPEYNKLKI